METNDMGAAAFRTKKAPREGGAVSGSLHALSSAETIPAIRAKFHGMKKSPAGEGGAK
jgi:hypothetical protein